LQLKYVDRNKLEL